jgi:hypothetical protein
MHFRFTIRDLLWLTALVAMGVGWWISNSNRKIGRYQYVTHPGGANNVLDTATGQMWTVNSVGDWLPFSPSR